MSTNISKQKREDLLNKSKLFGHLFLLHRRMRIPEICFPIFPIWRKM